MPSECSDQTPQKVPGGSDRSNRQSRTLSVNRKNTIVSVKCSEASHAPGQHFLQKQIGKVKHVSRSGRVLPYLQQNTRAVSASLQYILKRQFGLGACHANVLPQPGTLWAARVT